MSEECAVMTINDRESSKSPTGSHSIDDILGIKAAAAAAQITNNSHHRHQVQQMYSNNSGSGSDSSSDSSASEREASPSPQPAASLESCSSIPIAGHPQQQLLQMATLGGTPQQQLHRPGTGRAGPMSLLPI